MRLGVFIACIIALILVSRFYSLPPNEQQSETEPIVDLVSDPGHASSVPSVATAVYNEPIPAQLVSSQRLVPSSAHGPGNPQNENQAIVQASPALQSFPSMQAARVYRPITDAQGDLLTVAPERLALAAESELKSTAKNVQTLVRAQYEIPKGADTAFMGFKPKVLVETTTLDSGHPETTILQVTTDKKTQKYISGFLSAFYPRDAIKDLRDRTAQISDRDGIELAPDQRSEGALIRR